jgi:hypothetical protein
LNGDINKSENKKNIYIYIYNFRVLGIKTTDFQLLKWRYLFKKSLRKRKENKSNCWQVILQILINQFFFTKKPPLRSYQHYFDNSILYTLRVDISSEYQQQVLQNIYDIHRFW